jgi:hypothetical protein
MHDMHMPVETAIARHDDVIELLVALGADVNLPTKQALQYPYSSDNRRSLFDWVCYAVRWMSDEISKKQATTESECSIVPGWKGYHANLLRANDIVQEKLLAKDQATTNKDQALHGLIKIKGYFVDVERLLVSRQAKTWNDLYPEEKDKSTASQSITTPSRASPSEGQSQYLRMSGGYAPQYLSSSYDELYEACFTGNNEKVQQLCLPPSGFKTQAYPLQISVQTVHPVNQWSSTGMWYSLSTLPQTTDT